MAALAANDFFARERVGETSVIDRTERHFRKRLGSYIGEAVRVAISLLEAFSQVRLLSPLRLFRGRIRQQDLHPDAAATFSLVARANQVLRRVAPSDFFARGIVQRGSLQANVTSDFFARGTRSQLGLECHLRLFRSRQPFTTWPGMSLATFSLATYIDQW